MMKFKMIFSVILVGLILLGLAYFSAYYINVRVRLSMHPIQSGGFHSDYYPEYIYASDASEMIFKPACYMDQVLLRRDVWGK